MEIAERYKGEEMPRGGQWTNVVEVITRERESESQPLNNMCYLYSPRCDVSSGKNKRPWDPREPPVAQGCFPFKTRQGKIDILPRHGAILGTG